MPKITVKLSAFDLDKGRYSKTLDLAIKTQVRMAARAFLSVAMRAIPYRTGFARGSLKNLSDEVGLGNAAGPTLNVETPAGAFLKVAQILKKANYFKKDKSGLFNLSRNSLHKAGAEGSFEYYRDGKRRILKTPQSGREFATQPGHIFSNDGFIYTFNYESLITYLNINDQFSNPRNKGTPWGAFKAGRATFLNYLKTNALDKLPSVSDFITESTVSFSGGTVGRTAFAVINRRSKFRI